MLSCFVTLIRSEFPQHFEVQLIKVLQYRLTTFWGISWDCFRYIYEEFNNLAKLHDYKVQVGIQEAAKRLNQIRNHLHSFEKEDHRYNFLVEVRRSTLHQVRWENFEQIDDFFLQSFDDSLDNLVLLRRAGPLSFKKPG